MPYPGQTSPLQGETPADLTESEDNNDDYIDEGMKAFDAEALDQIKQMISEHQTDLEVVPNNPANNKNPKPEVAEEVNEMKTTSSSVRKRSGKAAKQKSIDKFRMKIGTKQHNENREAKLKSLGVFDESCAELEKSLKSLSVTLQKTAIPIPVATRGIGFSAAAEYGRMGTTWNLAAIRDICSIHAYYRVELHLAYFKLYTARCGQNDMESFSSSVPFTVNEEVRQVLVTVTQVPVSTANILAAIGRIEGSVVWHSIPFAADIEDVETSSTYIYPTNIRHIVEALADEQTPAAWRIAFHERNSIPGARWSPPGADDARLLLNADDIYPANYDVDALQNDVRAYKNLLTRVTGRLPKSFVSTISWTHEGCITGTASFDPYPCSLEATFKRTTVPGRKTRRNQNGCLEHIPGPAGEHYIYCGERHLNSADVIEVWTPDEKTEGFDLIMGAASYVGERAALATRLQINGRKLGHVSPGAVLYALVNAPRPKAT